MLPPFDEYGNLPAGIHACSMDEMVARFGDGSPERVVEIAELKVFVAWAWKAGVERIIVSGSFVTAQTAPNDVDIIILPGDDYPQGEFASTGSELDWPFLQVIVAADLDDLLAWSHEDFGTDRRGRTKGVVEVLR